MLSTIFMAQNKLDMRKAGGPPSYIGVPGFGGNISSAKTEPTGGMCVYVFIVSGRKRSEEEGEQSHGEICPRITVCAHRHAQNTHFVCASLCVQTSIDSG